MTIPRTTSFPQTQILDAALGYAGRGWRVFPLKPQGKTPLIKGGYKAATVSPTQIEAWWRKWPAANVGIATGIASGLVVIDVDSEQGLAFLEQLILKHEPLKPTETVKTARGWHFYYTLPETFHQLRCSAADGLDIRANGGYVVAPPSVHESGHIYRWVEP